MRNASRLLHARCRVDGNSGTTQGAYFHAHRNQDGMWATAAAMPRCRDGSGRPAAYVALNGEAQLIGSNTWSNVNQRISALLAGCQAVPSRCFERANGAAELDSGLLHRSVSIQKPPGTQASVLLSLWHAQVVHKCAGCNEANSRSGMAGFVDKCTEQ